MTNKSKACFAIPIHPPHYIYLNVFEKLPVNLDFDIHLVLSFKSDLDELNSLNIKPNYSVTVLEDYLSVDFIHELIDKRIIITFKKYFILNMKKHQYDYIGVVDSEIDFINTDNVYNKFKLFCNNKKFVGSTVTSANPNLCLVQNINRASAVFYDQDKISNITTDFRFYSWFSDIPIYDTKILIEFLDYIQFENYKEFCKKIEWAVFDYIPYIFYCVLFKDYKLINIHDFGIQRNWSLESMPYTTYLEIISKINYQPLWIIHNVCLDNREAMKEIILTYHRNNGEPNEQFM